MEHPLSYMYFKICKVFNISIEELSKTPRYKIEWMLLNIIEEEKRRQEEFKMRFDMVKPFLNIELYNAEHKIKKEEKNKIVSDNFDDVLLKHMYEPLSDQDSKKMSDLEKENKINEILDEGL